MIYNKNISDEIIKQRWTENMQLITQLEEENKRLLSIFYDRLNKRELQAVERQEKLYREGKLL